MFQFCCTLFWPYFSLNPDFVHKKSFWPEGVNTPLLFGNPCPYMASTFLFIFFPSHSLLSTFFDINAPVKYRINTKIMAKLFLHFRRLKNNLTCFFMSITFRSNTRPRYDPKIWYQVSKWFKTKKTF